MAVKRKSFRPFWLGRGSRRKQVNNRSFDVKVPARDSAARRRFPGVGSGLAALAIFASAFGPMPDESARIAATIGREDVGVEREMIDDFLTQSRRYLGL